jgi:outer membrane lipoprotein LolB
MKLIHTLILTLLLTACASLKSTNEQPQTIPWPTRQAQAQSITQWDIQGVIGIKSDKQNFSAHYYWIQQGDNYTISLYGPLGVGAIKLQGNQQTVILTNSDGKQYQASNPEQLMQENVGWSLPVSDLYYWIRALPSRNSAHHETFDIYNRLTSLDQEGWHIDYRQYQSTPSGDLPKKLSLKQSDIETNIVIQRWQLNPL